MSDLVQQACDAYDAVRGKDGPSPEGYSDYRAMEAALGVLSAQGEAIDGVGPDVLRGQLSRYADPDCRGCDGTGVFYGNVCVCACVLNTLERNAPKPVAYLVYWPKNPELGRYFSEAPVDGSRSRPLYTHPTPALVTEEMVDGLRRMVEACNQPCFTDKGEREISWAAVSWMQSNGPALLAALTAALEADKC